MIKIYCIEDINDLKYVGRTKQTISKRLRQHRVDKALNRNTSSAKLNLDNCVVDILETCSPENQRDREKYWINKIDCVNTHTYQCDDPDYRNNYYQENKGKILERMKSKYKKKQNFKSMSGHKNIHWDKHAKRWKFVSNTKTKYFKCKIDAICFKFIMRLKNNLKNNL